MNIEELREISRGKNNTVPMDVFKDLLRKYDEIETAHWDISVRISRIAPILQSAYDGRHGISKEKVAEIISAITGDDLSQST